MNILDQHARPELLIDEPGDLNLTMQMALLFFQLISKRYEERSIQLNIHAHHTNGMIDNPWNWPYIAAVRGLPTMLLGLFARGKFPISPRLRPRAR